MIFSSTIFLFGFLPCVLALYAIVPFRAKNGLLLVASLFFYGWGEFGYTLLMVVSVCWNYLFGRMLNRFTGRSFLLFIAVAGNLTLLGVFKYANFFVDNLNSLIGLAGGAPIVLGPVHLPLGISFFTFQAISYVVDVYRRETKAQSNILDLGLYISMFPQLIAGPIVRYNAVAEQLSRRTVTLLQAEEGVMRFVYGLAKKLLIANPLGAVADAVFALPQDQLSLQLVWVAMISYTLQIYFDFSGYSDMAIGLGRMFGFSFPENFNYPYVAKTVRDFWRRWHMSLTGWLRDYLYIPLGGSRAGITRVYVNLFVVFLLCGLWHGASWNFVVWGVWHGFFIVLERGWFGRAINQLPQIFKHAYLLLVVIVGWVFFRSENMAQAFSLLGAMVGEQGMSNSRYPVQLYLSVEATIAAVVGVILATPLYRLIKSKVVEPYIITGFVWRISTVALLLYASSMKISSGTYNPFLYFRF